VQYKRVTHRVPVAMWSMLEVLMLADLLQGLTFLGPYTVCFRVGAIFVFVWLMECILSSHSANDLENDNESKADDIHVGLDAT